MSGGTFPRLAPALAYAGLLATILATATEADRSPSPLWALIAAAAALHLFCLVSTIRRAPDVEGWTFERAAVLLTAVAPLLAAYGANYFKRGSAAAATIYDASLALLAASPILCVCGSLIWSARRARKEAGR